MGALEDVAWDGATSTKVYIGSRRVAPIKITIPDVETKVSLVERVGEPQAKKRTPGRTTVGNLVVEYDLADYAEIVMPSMPKHGGTLIETTISAVVQHPSVEGSYTVFCERCRAIKTSGPDIDGSEKPLTKKVEYSVLRLWEKAGSSAARITAGAQLGELPISDLFKVQITF
ncbi:MAG TPA: hypothetical protein VLT47_04440 [Anaeromyxobacteraceae bacterium]|nr:hypothetical protein [Anaeromyxobacteraceae bacterium]